MLYFFHTLAIGLTPRHDSLRVVWRVEGVIEIMDCPHSKQSRHLTKSFRVLVVRALLESGE